jgi:hypothetical protein
MLDSPNEFFVRDFEVLQAGIDVWFARFVKKSGQAVALNESAHFARRHGLALQIDKVNLKAAFFKEPLGCAGGSRAIDTKDLNGSSSLQGLRTR